MSKQFKLLLILVNAVLSLLYAVFSFSFWEELNNWYDWNMQSTWTPFYVYPHRIAGLSTVEMPVQKMLNLPFIIFLVAVVTNCVLLATYFLIRPRLQKWASNSI